MGYRAVTQLETISNTSGNGSGGDINITTYGIEEGQIAPGSGYYGYEYNGPFTMVVMVVMLQQI